MREIDAILETALANQQGEIILRVNTWTDAADYAANPNDPDYVWLVRKFDIYNTSAKATIITANDYTLSAFSVFTIERGVVVEGVEYTVESGLYHVRHYKETFGIIEIMGSSYPEQKVSIAGDGTYREVIEAFCAEIGKTAVFRNDNDPWLEYQFLADDAVLSLNRAEQFESLVRQKYTILIYEESPRNLLFYMQDSFEQVLPEDSPQTLCPAPETEYLVCFTASGSYQCLRSRDAFHWDRFTSTNHHRACAWSAELSRFCAVGTNSCATSPDGETWTSRTIPAGTYNACAWSPALSLFVAVGLNVCATSPDGITWTARTIPAGTWRNLVWSVARGIFLAVSDRLCTSADGISWNVRSTISSAWVSRGINASFAGAWSPSLSLFASIDNTSSTTVLTSPDGITWTSRTIPLGIYYAIEWSASLSLFVAVGTNVCATSPDGITWTSRTIPAGAYKDVHLSVSLGLFVAVGTNVCATSPDGITWTSRTIPAGAYYAVRWSASLVLFAAVGDPGLIATSPDGITWTARTSPDVSSAWTSLSYSASLGMFVAMSPSATSSMYSTDGITWTSGSAVLGAIQAIEWSPEFGVFMIVRESSAVGYYSGDGITWTQISLPVSAAWQGLIWSPALGMFVALGTYIATIVPVSTHNGARGAAWSEELGLFVVGGSCYTSPDGITWTSRTIPAGTYNACAWSPVLSLFVAIGNAVCATSPDGINWTARVCALRNWVSVVWAHWLSKFIACSDDGGGGNGVCESDDAETWQVVSLETDFTLTYEDGPTSYIIRDQSTVHYLWTDEADVLHTDGDLDNPQWNLGYLESTSDAPTTREDPYYKVFLQKAPVRLDIIDSDKMHFIPYWSIDPDKTIDAMVQVSEHLNLDKAPAWYQEIRSIIMFDGTEGGALPSSVARVGSYLPIVSTGFDGNLTPAVNNVQELAEAVDNLTLGGVGSAVFQRVLTASLALANGESLVVAEYVDLSSYDLTLNGDASLHIL